MAITVHQGDLPDSLDLGPMVAVDTETMGLRTLRDRLCVVQLSAGDGNAIWCSSRLGAGYNAPNLKRLLETPTF
jgi:Ribonuclease D